MSDPTPAGITPSPASYTLTDWTQILHNAAQVPQTHRRYAEARQVIQEALQHIGAIHQQQNQADSAALKLDPRTSFMENAAQGASMGLGSAIGDAMGQGTSDFLSQSRSDNPGYAAAGNIAGSGGVSTILAALGVPAPVAMGGPAGLQAGLETGSPTVGGVTGIATAVGGKLLGKATGALGLNALAGKAVGALAAKFATSGAAIADEEMIGNMSAGAIRRQLAKQGFSQEGIEGMLAKAKASLTPPTAPATRMQSGGVAVTPEVKGGGTATPGYAGNPKGVDVTGPRANPPVPTAPTITEIQDRLAGFGKAGARAGKAPTPSDALPTVSAQFQGVRNTMLDLRAKLGRDLTAEEREAVLQRLVSSHSQEGAARSAYHLSEAAGQPNPTAAARRAAGTYSTFDPRQGL
jgi:hypothetical protein